ncbi:MAG: DUF3105 domain-containing protein [Actinomycetota bacterium]
MTKKKKRKRPYTPPAQAGGDPEAPESVKPAPPPRGGAAPERRERKDEVRRAKERELKRWQRRQFVRKALIFLVVVGAIAGGVLFFTRKQAEKKSEFSGLIAQAAAATKAASCSPVEDVGGYSDEASDAIHVDEMPALSSYASQPPASGPHAGFTFPAGVETKAPELGPVLHSLEHGAAVIWYKPGGEDDPEFKEIADFVKANNDHTIMAPYDYPDEGDAGKLTNGTQMVLVAWHHVQTCKELSLPVVAKFLSEYRYPTLGDLPYEGIAPEKGAVI